MRHACSVGCWLADPKVIQKSVSFCEKTTVNVQLWHWPLASQSSNPSTHHKIQYISNISSNPHNHHRMKYSSEILTIQTCIT